MSRLAASLAGAGFIVYPLMMFVGLRIVEPRYLAVLLAALLLVRAIAGKSWSFARRSSASPRTSSSRLIVMACSLLMLFVIAFTFVSNRPQALMLYPVIISFSLLASFAASLVFPPSVIERIARLTDPDLSDAGVRYTRKVTFIWCAFFLVNGLIALYTSLYASIAVWTLYNGLVSYLLIGSLLGGEYLYRRLFLKRA